jgi:hypothetical protein
VRRRVLAVAVMLILPALVCAAGDRQHIHDRAMIDGQSPKDPPIRITINPEARVSVILTGALPPPTRCGTISDLPVKIVNQGFVTARLEAELVGDAPAGVTLDFRPLPLTGVPEEFRELHIVMTNPGPIDLTIAFRAHNETPDLGGRDRIHFLLRCLPVE